jgi:hypothetical protein
MIAGYITWPATAFQTAVYRFVSYWGDGIILPAILVYNRLSLSKGKE